MNNFGKCFFLCFRKNKILSILAAAALTGCTSMLEYDFDKDVSEIMVAGLLKQGDVNHTVFLSLLQDGDVKPLHDAAVRCYVNDRLVAENSAEYDEDAEKEYLDDSYFNESFSQLPLSFDAVFSPGDKVVMEFEADRGSYKASSAVMTVPEAAPIADASFEIVPGKISYSGEYYVRVHFDLPDRKNEKNWYIFELSETRTGTFEFTNGLPDMTFTSKRLLYLEDQDDLIMLDGSAPESEVPLFNSVGNGRFTTFTDALFADVTAHLKANVRLYGMNNINFSDFEKELRKHTDYNRRVARCHGSKALSLHLSNCSEQTYHYMKAYRTITSDNYVPEIVEPVTLPSNITGGTGFVDIVNTSTYSIILAENTREYNAVTGNEAD